MIRLFQIEWIKLWNSRSSRILIIAYFALLCSTALLAAVKFDIGPVEFHLAEMGIFNFPYIWHLNTFMTSLLKIFLAVVVVSMMANEYSYKTIKQNLIDGLSKEEFVASKFITVLSMSLASTIFVVVVSLVLGLIYSDYTEASIIFSQLDFIPAFFLKLTLFFSFCLFLGILVRKSAFALGFLFLWSILEQISFGLLGRYVLGRDWALAGRIKGFFPLESGSRLIEEPFTRLNAVQAVASQVGETFTLDYRVHWYEILIACVWIAIFIWASYRILKARDL